LYFSGRVITVIYEDSTQAFYILKMILDDDSSTPADFLRSSKVSIVKGYVPGMDIKVGMWFGFEGSWKNDPKYGKQLNIKRAPVFKDDWNPDTAEQMLSGNGVASSILKKIRKDTGDDDFIAALSDLGRLKKAGLDDFAATFVHQQWQAVQAYFKTLMFLADLGLPGGKIRQVWSHFEDSAIEVLSANPWALIELDGITFQQTDEIAMRLKLDMTDPNRIRGAVLFSCRSQQGFSGHLYLSTGQILGQVQGLVAGAEGKDVAKAIGELHKEKKFHVDRETRPGLVAVYDIRAWDMEQISTELMAKRHSKARFASGGLKARPYIEALASVGPKTAKVVKNKRVQLNTVVKKAVTEWGEYESLSLSKHQQEGIIHALKEPISILTGLPGTGKTTSLRAAVRIFQEAQIPFLLCAPTGIAAKNLATLTGARAYTIHRAFAAKGGAGNEREAIYAGITGDAAAKVGGFDKNGVWGYGGANTHPAQVVIVDEASMLDMHLLYRILTCTAETCRLVFVGDAAQLPSVGPGNVLRDMINSDKFPMVNLTEIFRQKDTSDIVFAAHDIHHGKVPKCEAPSDFMLIQSGSEDGVLETIKQVAIKLYGARKNFQILSPRHKGTVGVTNLNTHMREILNPQKGGLQELKMGHGTIREDDRIMIIKNNYKLGVFNGDVGKVSRIDRTAKEVELKIFGVFPLIIQVPFKDLSRLVRMAYACTVHKAQGLEYEYIVMPIVDGFRHQLQRNLLYTAVTRAKNKVILVGDHSALSQAVMNDREDLRNTLLKDRLMQSIPS